MWSTRATIPLVAAACCLAALPLAAAHGDETEVKMDMHMAPANSTVEAGNATASLPMWEDFPPSYFRQPGYQGWMLLHIVSMIVAWVFTMPAAIMLSVARSRYHLPLQLVFHAANGLGVFAGFVYNHSTPDLYEVNAHHPLSWVVTSLTVVWTLLSVLAAYNDRRSQKRTSHVDAHPTSSSSMPDFDRLQQYSDRLSNGRFSQDSGNFSESHSNSSESIHKKSLSQPPSPGASDDDNDEFDNDPHAEKRGFLGNAKVDRLLASHVKRFAGARLSPALRLSQIVLEKLLLLLGFAAITTGFITYGGIFRGDSIFSGLAHYIKGAIFFWYGLLSLGRWMGAFAEFGWAWNVRPRQPVVSRWKTIVPSAEFTESFVIWLYGTSNVFLEHLGKASNDWSPQDVEHISITILFFGGGLFGMLIESQWLRSLMNTPVEVQKSNDVRASPAGPALAAADEAGVDPEDQWQPTKADKVSLNPMPALTIMLLGMMMSAHHQHSMVSTMMHKQWGTLFTGFAMSRIATYVLLYVKPPTSHYASRPPTELIAAFCLIAGGLMFMNSAGDTVLAIETNGLDAMTIFTITMGLTGIIMAWEIVAFALKGWAQRKEQAAARSPLQ